MITFCTISNNIDTIDKIINKHSQVFPLLILYYDDKENDIIKINDKKNSNVNVYYSKFNNDYASLWNNLFSNITTDYIFWFNDTDIISDNLIAYLTSDELNKMLEKNEIETLSFKISNNLGEYNECRLVKRTLYPIWRGRVNPKMFVDGKTTLIDKYTIKSSLFEPMNYLSLYNLLLSNGEDMSFENLVLYINCLIKKGDYETLNTILTKIDMLNNNSFNGEQKKILFYNIAVCNFNIGSYRTTKEYLSKLDSLCEIPTLYYSYLMGCVYEKYELYELALKYYEIAFSISQMTTMSYPERLLIYNSDNIEFNILTMIANIYEKKPELAPTYNLEKKNGETI